MPDRRPFRRLITLALFTFFTLVVSGPLLAQQGNGGGNGKGKDKGDEPPILPQATSCPTCPVIVLPEPWGGTTVLSQLPFTIYWCSNAPIEGSSRWIKRNGTNITSSFSYTTTSSGCSGYSFRYKSSGTLNLSMGSDPEKLDTPQLWS